MPRSDLVGFSTAPPVLGVTPYINIQDQKPDGTSGGAFTSGGWRTRTLNTIVANVGGYAALNSNQISLSPGIYRCDITAPGWQVNDHVARLQNITTGTTIAEGVNGRSSGSSSHETSRIRTYFTLTSLSVLEVQHQCETSNGTDGFGRVSNFVTANEIYTTAEFWKLDGLTTPPPVGDFTVTIVPPVPYINIQDQKAQNTQGGTFTQATDVTRTLNTIVNDTAGIASLSSNQITLGVGTYQTRWRSPCNAVNFSQSWLYNVTDSVVLVRGGSMFSASMIDATGAGLFTISATKVLELRHRCTVTRNTDGLGAAANIGTEVYATIEFWKVA